MKAFKYFQIGASALFLVFAIINAIRCMINGLSTFYLLCFIALFFCAKSMLVTSIKELNEEE